MSLSGVQTLYFQYSTDFLYKVVIDTIITSDG